MSRHEHEHAMEHLFNIQQHDPENKEGAAREMIATVVNMMALTTPHFVQKYRRKLPGMLAQ